MSKVGGTFAKERERKKRKEKKFKHKFVSFSFISIKSFEWKMIFKLINWNFTHKKTIIAHERVSVRLVERQF